MPILIKTESEISKMREGGQILALILEELKNRTQAGMMTSELNDIAENLIKKYQVKASFKGYRDYPASICTAVNEEVVHAIPGDRVLNPGDIISLDCGIYHHGLHTDAAITVCLQPIDPAVLKFVTTVEKTLYKAIKISKPGTKIGDLSHLIQTNLEQNGYSVVHELTGHGIGQELHEPPQIPNYGKKNSGESLKPGMTIAIEPIACMGERYIKTLPDKWTIITKDSGFAAQIEHTILITLYGNEILTKKH